MRLSSLVVAAILFVSTTLLAQHTSGAGGSRSGGSSSGASHSSYSGGSSSSANSASSHNSSISASHVASTGAAASHLSPSTKLPSTKSPSTKSPSTKSPSTKVSATPEKKGFRSFLRHPFKKPSPVQTAEFKRPAPCLKRPCAVCPPGESRNGKGGCAPSVVANDCQPGQFWNGFACGTRYRVNDCSVLAAELAQQERQMRSAMTAQQQSCSYDSASLECAGLRGQSGGESLRYRQLQEQYDQCLAHSRSYAFRGTFLPGTLWLPLEDY